MEIRERERESADEREKETEFSSRILINDARSPFRDSEREGRKNRSRNVPQSSLIFPAISRARTRAPRNYATRSFNRAIMIFLNPIAFNTLVFAG